MAARLIPEGELAQFFKIYPDILAILDFEGRLRRVNAIWQTTLGFATEELLSRHIFDLAHPPRKRRCCGLPPEAVHHLRARGNDQIGYLQQFESRVTL